MTIIDQNAPADVERWYSCIDCHQKFRQANDRISELRAERDAMARALQRIAGLRLADSMGPSSMALEAVFTARAALDGAK